MARSEAHAPEQLTRYAFGDLSGKEQEKLERHLRTCTPCQEYLSFVQEFNAGLREAKPQRPLPGEPCPDPSLLIALDADELDDETAHHVRAHMLFCEGCRKEYTALERMRPKVVDVFLRAAGGLIEALCPPAVGEWQLLPATVAVTKGRHVLSAPFRVAETLTDPDSRSNKSKVALRVEEGIEPDRVRVVVESDPVPRQWKWKVYLFGAEEEELASMPVGEPQVEVAAGVPHGFYALEIRKNDDCLGRFAFTVEPFSLPEAVETVREYMAAAHYVRALVILEDAAERYPESREISDLQCLARELAASDADGFERDQRESGQVRGIGDFSKETWRVLNQAKARFGEGPAYVIGATRLDPSVFSDQVASRLKEEKPSVPVLQALELLSERVKTSDERVAQLLGHFTSRLDDFSALMKSVRETIDGIRGEADKEADEKFSAAAQLLERTEADIERKGLSLPDYRPLFRKKLGDACWEWTGPDAQKIFTSAEGLYWYLGSQLAVEAPDFSPALLQLCRGFELLLNERIRESCAAIWSTVRPRRELLDLMKAQHPNFEPDRTFSLRESISLGQFSTILRVGRVVEEAKQGTFGELGPFLTASPGLTDVEFLVPLAYVGTVFRNGKVHPRAGSREIFTTIEEMQLLRKLIFGLDESRVPGRAFATD